MLFSRFRLAVPLALAVTALTTAGAGPARAADAPTIPATVHRTVVDEPGAGDQEITLEFDGRPVTVREPDLDDLESGTRVKVAVRGASTGAEAVAKLTRHPGAITAVQVVGKPGPSAGTQGAVVHDVTVVPVTWAGATAFQRTTDSLAAMIRKALDEWGPLSRGTVTPGTVTMLDPVVIPDPGKACNIAAYANPAMTALGRGPTALTDHWVFVPSQSKGCSWSGTSYLPGNKIVLASDLPYGEAPDFGGAWWTVGHELGHNLGIAHAGNQVCTPACTTSEYGNNLEIMSSGDRAAAPENAYHSTLLGAFTAVDTPLVTGPGTYQLTSINEDSGVRGLRFDRSTGTDIYLEYRPDTPSGWTRPGWLGGLLANRPSATDPRYSVLLDLTPGQTMYGASTQPALMTGNTWQVPDTGLSMRLASADGPTATVVVTATATDTIAPASPADVTAPVSGTGWMTSSPTFPVSWTPAPSAAADEVVGYRVTVRSASGPQWVASTPADQMSVTMTLPTAEGWWSLEPMTINVQALDAAGNAGEAATLETGFDNVQPYRATILQPTSLSTVTSPTWEMAWSTPYEAGSGLSRYELLIDDAVVKTVPAGVNTATMPTPKNSPFKVAVRTIDVAGNESTISWRWLYR
ncbi:reprolysin-like metallopeptidase [Actinoplanes sp. NPDC026623]|uniref:reprolysin-like metallopeptidase n=1 Tax=Actinoplanes sp. NPDC026623 TaxID=3155610 RepID=UPI0033DC4D65